MTIKNIQNLLALTPEDLLKQCKIAYFQASGAGGQKRNRKLSAIRLTHRTTGIAVTSSEAREPARNLARAIQKLRLELVFTVSLENINENDIPIHLFRANTSELHPDFPGSVLASYPLFHLHEGSVGRASEILGVSSAALIRFFKKDKTLLRKVQDTRKQFGHYPLK